MIVIVISILYYNPYYFDHYYNPSYTGLEKLGLKPTKLKDRDILSMYEKVKNFENMIDKSLIIKNIKWI